MPKDKMPKDKMSKDKMLKDKMSKDKMPKDQTYIVRQNVEKILQMSVFIGPFRISPRKG
jgi:hypothetical protein